LSQTSKGREGERKGGREGERGEGRKEGRKERNEGFLSILVIISYKYLSLFILA
jgi:hypothetical protein